MLGLRLLLLAATLTLANCAVFTNCKDGETVDLPFGTECKGKKQPQQQSDDSSPLGLIADCLCKESSGLTAAYFQEKPLDYGTRRQLSVSTFGCKDTRLCMSPNTVYNSGTVSFSPISWGYEGFFGVFGAYGYQKEAQNRPSLPLRSLFVRVAASYTWLMRAAAGPITDNSIAGCRAICDAKNPHCLRLVFGGRDGSGLRWLHEIGLASPSVVSKNEVLKHFQQTKDTCNRGDIKISAGILQNVGPNGACTLETRTDVSAVALSIPQTVRAKYSVRGSSIEAVFDDPNARANLKFGENDLNALYGGDIVAVSSEPNHMGFSIGRDKCVRVSY